MERKRAYKALKIPADAYYELEKLKKIEMERARHKKELDKLEMLQAMGLGAFASYLIHRLARDMEKEILGEERNKDE